MIRLIKTIIYVLRPWLRYILAGLILIGLILHMSKIDYQIFIPVIKDSGPSLLLAFFMTVIAYFLSAWAWKFCFINNKNKISLSRLYIVRQIGETMTNLTPANIIGGDTTKLLLLKDAKVPSTEVVSSIIIARVFNLLSVIILGVISSCYFLFFKDFVTVRFEQVAITITVVIIFIALFYILFSPKLLLFKLTDKIIINKIEHKLTRIKSYIYQLNKNFCTLFSNQKKELALSYLLTTAHWILGALEFLILLHIFGYEASLMDAILIESGVQVLKSSAAFIPAQIGVEEYATKIMMHIVGCVSPEIWMAVCLMRRLRQIIWIGIGGIMIWIIGFVNKNKKQHGNLIHIA